MPTLSSSKTQTTCHISQSQKAFYYGSKRERSCILLSRVKTILAVIDISETLLVFSNIQIEIFLKFHRIQWEIEINKIICVWTFDCIIDSKVISMFHCSLTALQLDHTQILYTQVSSQQTATCI